MTPFQQNLAEKCVRELAAGGHLMESRSDAGDWYNYRMSSGAKVTQHVIDRLVAHGIIEASDDGLFGDSQTYRLCAKKCTQAEFLSRAFGAGWVQAKRGSNAALKAEASGKSVLSKSELSEAIRLYEISQIPFQMQAA